ncbi:MAG: ABC transporter permease [Gemmatimonadetes bacterium]|nr:ABC transporter permease [Gemmatimonadota bacterium]
MRVVWAVIRREYLQRVRSRWFVFATLGVPLLVLAALVAPLWFASQGDDAGTRLVILDRSGMLAEALAERLSEAGLVVEPAGLDEEEAVLDERVRAGEIEAYLVVDPETLTDGASRWVGNQAPSMVQRLMVRQAVAATVLERRLGMGPDAQRLLRGGDLEVEALEGAPAAGMETPAFVAAYVGSFVLYMVVLIYAVAVMRSVLEEKTSRIVEVVLASLRPWQLLLGKILGVGAVGLTQLAVWVAGSALLASVALPALLAARPELGRLNELREGLPGPGYLGLFLVFFLGGYFIYSALYAAVGAMCNSDEEAQQAQLPLMLLLVVPIIAVVGVIESPNSPLAVGLSLVPFFSPVLMFARAAAGAAPAWQVALSLALMAATVPAVAWVGGRIYRVGILMTGKRPTLPELWRWVRES